MKITKQRVAMAWLGLLFGACGLLMLVAVFAVAGPGWTIAGLAVGAATVWALHNV